MIVNKDVVEQIVKDFQGLDCATCPKMFVDFCHGSGYNVCEIVEDCLLEMYKEEAQC